MSVFDEMAGMMGGLDIDALAATVGIDPAQAGPIAGALLQKIGGEGKPPEVAAAETAGESGQPIERIEAMLGPVLDAINGGGLSAVPGEIRDVIGDVFGKGSF